MLKYIAIALLICPIVDARQRANHSDQNKSANPPRLAAALLNSPDAESPNRGAQSPTPKPPEPDRQAEIAKAAQATNDRIARATVIIAVFGGLSFLATCAYIVAAFLQWNSIKKQANKAEAQLEVVRKQSRTMLGTWRVIRQQTRVMKEQLEAINKQEGHLSIQADAAKEAADMAKGQLVAMQHQEQAQFQQLDAIKAQAKTMDRSLVLGTRAYVGIQSVGLDVSNKRLFLHIENVGAVPAKDIMVVTEVRAEVPETKYESVCRHMDRARGYADWGVKNDNRWLQIPYLNRLGRTKLFPGNLRIPVMIRFDDSPYFSDEQFSLITGGYAKFSINGVITYSDGFHSGKKTEFAFRYFSANTLWVPEIVDFHEMQIDPEKPDSDYGGHEQS
jgi:hypothetical protein